MPSDLTKAESTLLKAIRENPGLLWYEAGKKAWPSRTVQRVNIFGEPFRELNGPTAALCVAKLRALKEKGLVQVDANHRIYATEP